MLRPEYRDKPIRSFVIRQGRMTKSQKLALEEHWDQYGLSLEEGSIDAGKIFGRSAPTVLEIGYGMGNSLADMASSAPEQNFIGVEVHTPGVGSLLHIASERSLTNLRTYMADATDVLKECIGENSLQRIQIYFPDPWPKKKHHKRRLVQPELVQLLIGRLVPGGLLHLATDWQPYAEHMHEVLKPFSELENQSPSGDFVSRPNWRPLTKFEARGTKLGHQVFDLLYKKSG
jgi:tRNA (guanine-N7-)-methyltransferase